MPAVHGKDSINVSVKLIIALLVSISILFIINVIFFYMLSNDIEASILYTSTVLFDSIGVNGEDYFLKSLSTSSPLFAYLFIIFIIDGLAKIIFIGFLFAAFIDIISSLNIRDRIFSVFLKKTKNHIIICGYSKLANNLIKELEKKDDDFVVIDKDLEKVDILRNEGYKVIYGDFSRKDVLMKAAIERAKAIIFASKNDMANLFGIVTAKHLNKKIYIIARATEPSYITKFERAGANKCIIPEEGIAIDMYKYITNVIK